MYIEVSTRNGIKSRKRGGFSFGPTPKIVQLDERKSSPRQHKGKVLQSGSLKARKAEIEAAIARRDGTQGNDRIEIATLNAELERVTAALISIGLNDMTAPSSSGGDRERYEAIIRDSDPKHGGLLVTELTEAEARRRISRRPETEGHVDLDSDRLTPEARAELETMRAQVGELASLRDQVGQLEAEAARTRDLEKQLDDLRTMLASQGLQMPAAPAPTPEPAGDDEDRAGRTRLGRKQR